MNKVFISFSINDGDLAKDIARALDQAGISNWYYLKDEKPGQSYLEKVALAISECQVGIILLSKNSLQSQHVENEVTALYERKKEKIPVLVDIDQEDLSSYPIFKQALGTIVSVAARNRDRTRLLELILDGTRACLAKAEAKSTTPHGPVEQRKDDKRPFARRFRRYLVGLVLVGLAACLAMIWYRLPPNHNPALDPVRALVYGPVPPEMTNPLAMPGLQCEFFLAPEGQNAFQVLRNGDTVTSRKDRLFAGVRAFTPGYLYVFTLESDGRINWLFGQDGRSYTAAAANPLAANQSLAVPAASNIYLHLDSVPGTEYFYLVYAPVRWNQLEERLKAALNTPPAAQWYDRPLGDRGELGEFPAPNTVVMRALNEKWVSVEMIGPASRATNGCLVLERWFRHP